MYIIISFVCKYEKKDREIKYKSNKIWNGKYLTKLKPNQFEGRYRVHSLNSLITEQAKPSFKMQNNGEIAYSALLIVGNYCAKDC